MFARVSSVLALALCASASVFPRGDEIHHAGRIKCSTGPIQCCNSVQTASSVALLLGSLGVSVGSMNDLVGFTCNPISVIAFGSISCSAQAVCCKNNHFNGVIALGCTPIDVGSAMYQGL